MFGSVSALILTQDEVLASSNIHILTQENPTEETMKTLEQMRQLTDEGLQKQKPSLQSACLLSKNRIYAVRREDAAAQLSPLRTSKPFHMFMHLT